MFSFVCIRYGIKHAPLGCSPAAWVDPIRDPMSVGRYVWTRQSLSSCEETLKGTMKLLTHVVPKSAMSGSLQTSGVYKSRRLARPPHLLAMIHGQSTSEGVLTGTDAHRHRAEKCARSRFQDDLALEPGSERT